MKKDAVGLSTAKGELIRGAQLLNGRFIALWAKDNYRDYTDGKKSRNLEESRANEAQGVFTGDSKNEIEAKSTLKDSTNQTFVSVDTNISIGDERIHAADLRSLLTRRPDLVTVLQGCLAPALGEHE